MTRRLVPFRLELITVDEDDAEDTLVVRTKDQRRIVARAFEDLSIDEEAAVPSRRDVYVRDDLAAEENARRESETPPPLQSGTRPVAAPVSEVPSTSPSLMRTSFPTVPVFEEAFENAFERAFGPDLAASAVEPAPRPHTSSLGLVRSSLSPAAQTARRASLEAARRAHATVKWLRVVVVGIWGTALVLAAILALFGRIGT